MEAIIIEIDNYKQCPNFKITGVDSTDGFDRGEDWFCSKANKQIANFVEWRDKVEVPKWCPCLYKPIN